MGLGLEGTVDGSEEDNEDVGDTLGLLVGQHGDNTIHSMRSYCTCTVAPSPSRVRSKKMGFSRSRAKCSLAGHYLLHPSTVLHVSVPSLRTSNACQVDLIQLTLLRNSTVIHWCVSSAFMHQEIQDPLTRVMRLRIQGSQRMIGVTKLKISTM
jgi:hypothetical protein